MGAGSIFTTGTPTQPHAIGQRRLHVVDHALPSVVMQQRTQLAIDQRALQPRDAEGKEHLVVPDVAPTLYAGRGHLGDANPRARPLPHVEPVHSIGYIERTIALATHAVQHASNPCFVG